MTQYKTTKTASPIRPSPHKTKSLDRNNKLKISKTASNYMEYEKFKKTQNENPETFRIGDRHSNFRSK